MCGADPLNVYEDDPVTGTDTGKPKAPVQSVEVPPDFDGLVITLNTFDGEVDYHIKFLTRRDAGEIERKTHYERLKAGYEAALMAKDWELVEYFEGKISEEVEEHHCGIEDMFQAMAIVKCVIGIDSIEQALDLDDTVFNTLWIQIFDMTTGYSNILYEKFDEMAYHVTPTEVDSEELGMFKSTLRQLLMETPSRFQKKRYRKPFTEKEQAPTSDVTELQ